VMVCDSTAGASMLGTRQSNHYGGAPLGLGSLRFERVASSCRDLPSGLPLPPPPPHLPGRAAVSLSPRPSAVEAPQALFARHGSVPSTCRSIASHPPHPRGPRSLSRPAAGGGCSTARPLVSSSLLPRGGCPSYVPAPRRSESFTPCIRVDSFAPAPGCMPAVGSSAVPPVGWATMPRKDSHIRAPSSGVSTTVSNISLRASSTVISTGTSRSPSGGPQSPRWLVEKTEEQDLIDQHVQYYLRHHPRVAGCHSVNRISVGIYNIDGHEVEVEWQHHSEVGRPGHLVVVDGPLKQPFADYLAMSEANAEYDTHTIAKTSALHHVPKERRMTFDDTHKKYSRLEAMRVAKEQASIREKAADYTRDGKEPPEDLVKKYNKNIRNKLGRRGAPATTREASAPAKPKADENTDPLPNLEAAPPEPPLSKLPVAPAAKAPPHPPPPPLTTTAGAQPAPAQPAWMQGPSPQQVCRAPLTAAGCSVGEASYMPPTAAAVSAAFSAGPQVWSYRGMSTTGSAAGSYVPAPCSYVPAPGSYTAAPSYTIAAPTSAVGSYVPPAATTTASVAPVASPVGTPPTSAPSLVLQSSPSYSPNINRCWSGTSMQPTMSTFVAMVPSAHQAYAYRDAYPAIHATGTASGVSVTTAAAASPVWMSPQAAQPQGQYLQPVSTQTSQMGQVWHEPVAREVLASPDRR